MPSRTNNYQCQGIDIVNEIQRSQSYSNFEAITNQKYLKNIRKHMFLFDEYRDYLKNEITAKASQANQTLEKQKQQQDDGKRQFLPEKQQQQQLNYQQLQKQQQKNVQKPNKITIDDYLWTFIQTISAKYEFSQQTKALGVCLYYKYILNHQMRVLNTNNNKQRSIKSSKPLPNNNNNNKHYHNRCNYAPFSKQLKYSKKFIASICLLLSAKTIQLDRKIPKSYDYQYFCGQTYTNQESSELQLELLYLMDFNVQKTTIVTFSAFYLAYGVFYQSEVDKIQNYNSMSNNNNFIPVDIATLQKQIISQSNNSLKSGKFLQHQNGNPETQSIRIIKRIRTKHGLPQTNDHLELIWNSSRNISIPSPLNRQQQPAYSKQQSNNDDNNYNDSSSFYQQQQQQQSKLMMRNVKSMGSLLSCSRSTSAYTQRCTNINTNANTNNAADSNNNQQQFNSKNAHNNNNTIDNDKNTRKILNNNNKNNVKQQQHAENNNNHNHNNNNNNKVLVRKTGRHIIGLNHNNNHNNNDLIRRSKRQLHNYHIQKQQHQQYYQKNHIRNLLNQNENHHKNPNTQDQYQPNSNANNVQVHVDQSQNQNQNKKKPTREISRKREKAALSKHNHHYNYHSRQGISNSGRHATSNNNLHNNKMVDSEQCSDIQNLKLQLQSEKNSLRNIKDFKDLNAIKKHNQQFKYIKNDDKALMGLTENCMNKLMKSKSMSNGIGLKLFDSPKLNNLSIVYYKKAVGAITTTTTNSNNNNKVTSISSQQQWHQQHQKD